MLQSERDQHVFDPPDFLHVMVDITNPRLPFVTSTEHVYHEPSTGMTLRVPREFRCDFASFPRVLWWILPRVGRYSRAALFHDYLYFSHSVNRFRSDAIFRTLMCVDKVPYWQRMIFFMALRVFGGYAWRNYR